MDKDIFRILVNMAVKQARTITDDKEALEVQILYPDWKKQLGKTLVAGQYIRYEDVLYKVLMDHTVQADWAPSATPSLFAKVLVDPSGETILEWQQPDSTNPYMKGDKVTYNGITYISIIDNNIWQPGVYGWEIMEG